MIHGALLLQLWDWVVSSSVDGWDGKDGGGDRVGLILLLLAAACWAFVVMVWWWWWWWWCGWNRIALGFRGALWRGDMVSRFGEHGVEVWMLASSRIWLGDEVTGVADTLESK
jgi:hypothetical protein